MVSSDFGKLDVMRHLISGDDCAIAGEATAVTAAPVADTFKKSRRFIHNLLCGRFQNSQEHFQRLSISLQPTTLWRDGLTRMLARGNATSPTTAPIKRKLNATILSFTRRNGVTPPQ